MEGDGGGQLGADPFVRPAQVGALFGAGGEAAAVGAGPFGEGGSGAHRSFEADGVVGEDGDVLGAGVHPEQRGLVGAPDPAGAGRVRVDEVEVEGPVAVQLGQGGREPLQEAGAARSRADDHQRGGAHRPVPVPRA
ncbi:hypothetical protein GCM10017667_62620 [Streptomyces filamentosus]|uniref:Uncharacterized protein n=1 Tax=Streptomyces filamentosus TaxID=67294 RepID=A0A919BV41_STRFL|nr:hypothetical protein GCM10017667_62620 [Streptomyces filamentosus]